MPAHWIIRTVFKYSADEKGRSQYKLPGSEYVAYVFVVLGNIIFVDWANQHFQNEHKSLCKWEPVFPIWGKEFLDGPSLLGGPEKFFHRGPNPLSAAVFK